jgi:membrane protease YdiL (CAAX protease family)
VTTAGARLERLRVDRTTRFYAALAAYTVVIAAGELSIPFLGAVPAAIVDAALMVVLIVHATAVDGPARRLLAGLGLVAMLRTLSVAAALPGLPAWAWYPAVGLPLLAGLLLARSRLGTRPTTVPVAGTSWAEWLLRIEPAWLQGRLDLAVAAAGIPASLVGYFALRPTILALADPATALAAIAGLLVAAAVEELLFRGILQAAALDVFGDATRGVAYAAAISALLYLGAGSLLYVALMLGLSLMWGFAVARGASLVSTTASHTTFLVGAGILWPLLLH